ncbi:pentapeptide repeat-containing protein [Nocardia sp. XZ_19_385]|uniref:pentapeptide repeat-containing protein n=1 Tax=Nocardia sp. XZ_19_385 TaxID=2769488 RepID=UPI00188F8D42|nr:pentapeptide repeat-containing protein [Nocardia sp. XZ_19_385]
MLRRVVLAVVGWGGWTKLAAIATTVAALGALWFTSKSLAATADQYRLAQQTQVTERFSKAVEGLSSDKIDVRLGGIYLLERLARDSPQDHMTVFDVLGAFVRTHSPADGPAAGQRVGLDIQAAVVVISRRDRQHDTHPVDLSGSRLAELRLTGLNLTGVNLAAANLAWTRLENADLTGVNLSAADLTGATLKHADLRRAALMGGHLSFASFDRARLENADFTGATLTDAWFQGTEMGGTTLAGADLGDAHLESANLNGALLGGVKYNSKTAWPPGFTPPPPVPAEGGCFHAETGKPC